MINAGRRRGGQEQLRQLALGVALVLAVAFAVACGDDSDEDSATGASTSVTAGVREAAEAVAPLEKRPTEIGITAPLESRPEGGGTIVALEQPIPVEKQVNDGITEAAEKLGFDVVRVNAGVTPQDAARAWNQVFGMTAKPVAVAFSGISTKIMHGQLQAAKERGIPVFGFFTEDDPLLTANLNGAPQFEYFGRTAGQYLVAKSEGKANVVIFGSQQIPGQTILMAETVKTIEELCPACETETIDDLSPTDIGTKAPGRVVSYLQTHPDVNWIYFAGAGFEIGAPEALAAAGLGDQAKILTNVGNKVTYQYVQAGKVDADLTQSPPMFGWKIMDAIARHLTGQDVAADTETQLATQFLTRDNITFDPAKGWPGPPGWKGQFEKLWRGDGG